MDAKKLTDEQLDKALIEQNALVDEARAVVKVLVAERNRRHVEAQAAKKLAGMSDAEREALKRQLSA